MLRPTAYVSATMLIVVAAGGLCLADLPRPTFYLPLDGSPVAAIAGGEKLPVRDASNQADTILELIARRSSAYPAGRVGRSFQVAEAPLAYACPGNFRADEGTVGFWASPDFRGDDRHLYSALFGAADWGMIYKYEADSSLTFATAKPDKDLYYDCGIPDISAWRPGQWHHVVATWSRKANERRLYVDGKLGARAPFPYNREVRGGQFYIGAGCTMYPEPRAHARLDEFAIWDQALDEASIQVLYALGQAGKPVCDVPADATPVASADAKRINVVHPRMPATPAGAPVALSNSDHLRRTTVSLNGWWQLLPARDDLAQLPEAAWGLTRVPGYWTANEDTIGPDAVPVRGQWEGRPLSHYGLAYYQRDFAAEATWKDKTVLLQLDGVDGLAQVFVNGRSLGWLPGWEYEAWDISPLLQYGGVNTVTVAVHTRGGSEIAGIYGDVFLSIGGGELISDVTVRPLVEQRQIRFSCGIRHHGPAADATLEFAVCAKSDPSATPKRFAYPVKLAGGGVEAAAPVSGGLQRIECSFDWTNAHLWTVDDPFLYEVMVTLRVGTVTADAAGPYRFGYREFALRGADLTLNGKPVHLRGHQIDLAWGDQFSRVKELKAAGLNALELSGPVCSDWYRGIPYHKRLFEKMLDYCDEQGLIAVPILPDLPVIRDRIFEPEVAKLYRQRVEKHIRRYGNHACIGMWYMHFNLSGYMWYIPPTKIDGIYQPTDARFQNNERFAMEAQKVAQEIDPRPIYHHACGNLGDIITSNMYLGPNSPLQEREEWPSRWAEKRIKPFIACEHDCMLICFWYRPRQFPLEVVYAGEPLFDEISAMFLGPQVYDQITPELFDLYDTGREPRGSRLHSLIVHHPGYQATKALVAERALRAWRTYGVTGIIFNAENCDWKDDAGNALPPMKAMARYFGDTDLYIVGPQGNWPSKDHAFHAGERVRKQVVLLNDLTRDIPCTLQWRLTDAAGKTTATGWITATSQGGVPTFHPVEFTAPDVAQRTEYTLTIEPASQVRHDFKAERFAIQVFPRAQPPRIRASVLLYDPAGDTAKMLRRAGVVCPPLSATSDLSRARLVIVGRRGYDAGFRALARQLRLEQAVRSGLRLLVFEQTGGDPFGLKLTETSTRDTWPTGAGKPLLAGLEPDDLRDLRGESDVIAPYPEAPPETQYRWPARCFKWGNRGVAATYVYDKPHYAPFVPVLQCGFDLAQSPLLEARFGTGRVVLCQMDVTPRYGTDPAATKLADNLLRVLTEPPATRVRSARFLGASAEEFVRRYGVVGETGPSAGAVHAGDVTIVGKEDLSAEQVAGVQDAVRAGATVVLLPNVASGPQFGLQLRDERVYMGRLVADPLLAGMSNGDVFLKAWVNLRVASETNGWSALVAPGLLASRTLGKGRLIACQLDPDALGKTRGRIKALRFWNLLLANLGIDRAADSLLLQPIQAYEPNEWETIPPYMSW